MKKFFYRVKDGETVFCLCKRFNLSQTKLISDNQLKKEIASGDILYIEQTSNKLYTVKVGDTIESIAKYFNLQESEILEKNRIPYVFFGLTIEI